MPPSKPPTKSTQSSREDRSLGATVQKFRDYYKSIKRQGGDQLLSKTFSQERELSSQIEDEQQRAVFLAIVQSLEEELLP
jgi:hypothetical protein